MSVRRDSGLISEFQQCTSVRVVQIRAAALTATQCASYDLAKQWWMRQTGMRDNVCTHLGASMLTGLATTTITAPVDLVKTNMFVGELPLLLLLLCIFRTCSLHCVENLAGLVQEAGDTNPCCNVQ